MAVHPVRRVAFTLAFLQSPLLRFICLLLRAVIPLFGNWMSDEGKVIRHRPAEIQRFVDNSLLLQTKLMSLGTNPLPRHTLPRPDSQTLVSSNALDVLLPKVSVSAMGNALLLNLVAER